MRAAVYSGYGSADVVQIRDIEKPVPKDDEVLIKVRAASINPIDWRFLGGKPYSARILLGMRKPRRAGIGRDIAGQVEAVGRNVTGFKPGDEVFGTCRGAIAEYGCAAESKVVMKPAGVTFEQAASVPVAGLTALQGLRDKGKIRAGQRVLINGAAGGVGTFAVQVAKSLGADVTGVCSGGNVEMVRSIGADEVVDYTREDFTNDGKRYDAILDCVGNHSLSAYRRVLNPQGVYMLVGFHTCWMLGFIARPIRMLALSRLVKQDLVMIMGKVRKEDLIVLGEMVESGKVRPAIDRRYKLSEVAEAIEYAEKGHARGKVIISLEDNSTK